MFRGGAIAGRGVFARRAFRPGETIVAYAPAQRKIDASSPEADAAAQSKLTIVSGPLVIVPDTTVPGGWLCNHSCEPNAALHASGDGHIACTRPIAPGDEVTIFYGWVSENEPARDRCVCGSSRCRGFINFDITDADVDDLELTPDRGPVMGDSLRKRVAEYGAYLRSIGQEHVLEAIASRLVRMKRRRSGG